MPSNNTMGFNAVPITMHNLKSTQLHAPTALVPGTYARRLNLLQCGKFLDHGMHMYAAC